MSSSNDETRANEKEGGAWRGGIFNKVKKKLNFLFNFLKINFNTGISCHSVTFIIRHQFSGTGYA